MALIDRLARTNSDAIRGHEFEAALWLWLRGHITKTQLVTYFSIDSEGSARLDEFQSTFNALNNTAKLGYFSDVTAAIVGLQVGAISQSLFKQIVGIT